MPDDKPKALRLPDDGIGSGEWWCQQLDWAADIRKDLLPAWRKNARAYEDKLKPPQPDGIRVNIEYEKTEQKKYQLFYRLPALKLKATPRTIRDAQPQTPTEGQPPAPPQQPRDLKRAISIFREWLTRIAGPRGANTQPTMEEVIFDVLCPSGIGFVKVGYERYEDGQVEVPTGAMIPDPELAKYLQEQPGAAIALAGQIPQIPEVVPAPNVIAEKYYAERISPACGLVPPEFRGSDYTRCDWLGYDDWITEAEVKRRKWPLPDKKAGTYGGPSDDDDRITELPRKGARSGQMRYREVFYYASRIDSAEKHPDRIRRLVFLAGNKTPVVHENFRHQRFDDRGRFTGGLRTHPIKVATLRYVSDSAHPPSDCQITRTASDALAEFRTSQVIHRRQAIPRVAIDVEKIANDKIKQAVLNGTHYENIPVMGNPTNIAAEIGRPSYPQENWKTNDALTDDINRAFALGANQSGTTEGGQTTATEVASIAQATGTRMGGEREKIVNRFWLSIIEDLGALGQLYMDHEDYVEVLGEDGAKKVEAFTKDDIQGEFLFDVVTDSSKAPDASADRDLALNAYNLLANDPFTNREQLTRFVYEEYGLDGDRFVRVPEPAPPEKPKISLAISGDDLNPAMPQYANIVSVLIASGIPAEQLSPVAAPATTEDTATGPADVVDRERMRMAEADERDHRSPGGLVGAVP
jgi:hypothetical protein